MLSRTQHLILPYAFAAGSVGLVLALKLWFGVEQTGLAPLFFAAVMFSAWYGGLGPGLLATGLAAFVTAYFFMDPPGSLWIGPDDFIRTLVFLATAVLISWLHARTRRAHEEAAQAHERAAGAMQEALAANRAKDRFLAILSHELRNPLNPVLTLARLQEQDPALPLSVREDAAMVRRNIELEVRLIDDLLDLNRLARDKLQLHVEQVNVREVVEDALRICTEDLSRKRLQMEFRCTAEALWAEADGVRLRQIVWNLLRNAAKFTPAEGEVRVAVEDDSPGILRLTVADTGAGIAPEVLPRLFTPFEQGGESVTRQFGGLGLGLVISKTIAELHGGTLEAASPGLGQGATFTLRLPAGKIPASQSVPPDVSSPAEARPLRLLLVEDHDDTRRIMRRLLVSMGHEVRTAASVGEALDAAGTENFDLIISDLGLPDGSGTDLLRQLAARRPVRAIALTGHGMESDIEATRAAGFAAHLTKPIDIGRLQSILDSAMDSQQIVAR